MRTVAATGGTFDIMHQGHRMLLSAALDCFDYTILGLVTDSFAARQGKTLLNDYDCRLQNLEGFIKGRFSGEYGIYALDDVFGPAVLSTHLDALVVSEETAHRGGELNILRLQKGLAPASIVIVPMVRGADGTRISSTKIRDGLMAPDGSLNPAT